MIGLPGRVWVIRTISLELEYVEVVQVGLYITYIAVKHVISPVIEFTCHHTVTTHVNNETTECIDIMPGAIHCKTRASM